ncbi:MAG: hypothetical protein DRH24_15425 [Deltaproteobacteria bacterium]|nr:MAG: hypothetical protein DRH24_15425 [Deltaproteobacteria bacterium]
MYTPTYAGDMGLVDLLSSQLGVTKDQAKGGTGSIFLIRVGKLRLCFGFPIFYFWECIIELKHLECNGHGP